MVDFAARESVDHNSKLSFNLVNNTSGNFFILICNKLLKIGLLGLISGT